MKEVKTKKQKHCMLFYNNKNFKRNFFWRREMNSFFERLDEEKIFLAKRARQKSIDSYNNLNSQDMRVGVQARNFNTAV
jgi:hypothetical protein